MVHINHCLQELQYCQTVVLSVVDDLGVRVVMDELLSAPSQADGKYCTLHCAFALKIKL